MSTFITRSLLNVIGKSKAYLRTGHEGLKRE